MTIDQPRILIIDDDPCLRETLADILRRRGYDTLTAKNGAEGLALMEQKRVHLALVDLGLPDMSGMKVLERIKLGHPPTEAIILTGNATLDSAIEATNRGAFSYLVKPYKIDQLLLNARHAIEKQRAEEEIVRHTVELERINSELKALYEMSLSISRTIEMDELLSDVLRKLVEIDTFGLERTAAAFLVEGDGLRLASHVGFSEFRTECCTRIPIGECICGLALTTGEIIILPDDGSGRAADCPDMPLLGNVALPLKMADSVLGVITLKTRPGFKIDGEALKLLSALGNQIGVAVNNAKLYGEAKNFSLSDALTGLGNRRLLNIQMEKSVETAKRYGEKLSVIMMDIDHFKKYNDEHGHVEGDRLLVRIAGILLEQMRSSDYLFRYGGEEFFAILPQTDMATACEVAERLRRSVESGARVTISLGVSTHRNSMRNNEELINTADTALYQAKQGGRNRVVANLMPIP